MKKLITILLSLTLLLSFIACGHMEEAGEEGGEREIIKLKNFLLSPMEIEQKEPTIESISLPYAELTEDEGQQYAESDELRIFADYALNELGIELNENWQVFIHYYDTEKTLGMVQLRYYIGEIGTNKSIVFNLNNGIADTVYYSNLEGSVDEDEIISRVEGFKAKYEQEKYEIKDGEEIYGETTDFSYYYDTGDLVYCYNVFILTPEGVINNDYGSECRIDENGNAKDCEIMLILE